MESGTQHVTLVYLAYSAVSVGLTIWLARTLSKNGEVFLEDVFADNPRMVKAVNQLLVVGFYLVNLGYALITLKAGSHYLGQVEAIETLASKLGALLLALAAMHFGNLYLFHRMRRRAQIRLELPPVQPQLQRMPQHG